MDFASETVGTALRLPALIISLSCHEFAHAWTANSLGDDTARKEGRLTLNPLAHLSLLGTLFIIFAPFGWAKPVPFNPLNFRSPLRDSGRVAFAGPLTNLFLSGIALCLFVLIFGAIPITKEVNFLNFVPQGAPALQLVGVFLRNLVVINFSLAVFNLLPIPPLDGGHILQSILPTFLAKHVFSCATSGAGTVIFLILIGTGIIDYAFLPVGIFLMLIFALGLIPAILYLLSVSSVGFLFWFTTPAPGEQSRRSFAACARALATVGFCVAALGLVFLSGANYLALRNERSLLVDQQDYRDMNGTVKGHKSVKPFAFIVAQCEVPCGSETEIINLPASTDASEYATGTKIPLLVKTGKDGEKLQRFYVRSHIGKRSPLFWFIHGTSVCLALVLVFVGFILWPRGGFSAEATPYPAEFVQVIMARAGRACSLEDAKIIAEQWASGGLPEEQNEELAQVTAEYVEELSGTAQEKSES